MGNLIGDILATAKTLGNNIQLTEKNHKDNDLILEHYFL